MTLAGHETARLFVCLSHEFFGWVAQGSVFLAPVPGWASISETQVALNEAGGVGMGPLSKPRPDQTLLLLALAAPLRSLPLCLPNLVTVGKNMR